MNKLGRVVVLTAILVNQVMASGPEFVPAQEKAQGQSLTGANLLNDSLYSNPAASAFTQVYSVEGAFLLPKTFAVSVLDTRTSALGGALGYFRRNSPNTEIPVQGVKLGLGGKVSSNLGAGITGKAVWGPNVAAPLDIRRLNDLDMGLLYSFQPLHVGFAVRNVLGGEAAFEQAREWNLGLRTGYQDILFLSATLTSTWGRLRPTQYGVGFEYISPYYFSLKGGYRLQPEESASFWSAGASFLSPKLCMHYAVELPNQGAADAVEHLLSISILM